jgi:hypothetical protein
MPFNAVSLLNGGIQMDDEHIVNQEQEVAPQTKQKQTRQRSSVPFAYVDLQDVMEVAVAIQEHVGSGDCDEHQLSAWLKKSQKSSGFRSVWSTARLFGLIETENGKFRLSPLGRRAVDPAQERDAKAKAFLTVPLYNKLFENYKGVAFGCTRARISTDWRRRETETYGAVGARALRAICRVFRAWQRSARHARRCSR